MSIVQTRISVWEALAGRAPGRPLGPADPGLWSAVAERVNPAKARPVVRPGIETAELTSARGAAYVMLRSPDRKQACYLRLAPEEYALTRLMDGSRTLARLVAEFARISGRLAPEQVRRIVADLAGNRMLEELPVDAFAPLQRVRRRPWPLRLGRGLLAFAQGRRMVLANVDPVVGFLYKAGGRLLFTRAAAALMGTVAVLGLGAFGWQWFTGEQSVFLSSDSYALGAAVLLGLNVLALACHELGHALATKHAGRRVPAAGFLVYFGIPSVFVDTTDVWMSGRRARLLTTAAGPSAGLVLAGASALVGLVVPEAAPWCFKLSFAWYINAMFNLNPFLALDGYYLVMDWLEVPNLRARGLSWVVARLRRRPPSWKTLDREGRLVALYGMLAIGWLVIALNIGYRVYVDRVGGLITGLWRAGWTARALLVIVIVALLSPVVYVLSGWTARHWRRLAQRLREARVERDQPRRLAALRASSLRDLPSDKLAALAGGARWVYPRTGQQLIFAGAAQTEVYAVVEGALEGRAQGDPGGTVRERVGAGGVVGIGPAISGSPSPLSWYTAGTRLLAMPSSAVAAAVGPLATDRTFITVVEAEELFAESPALASLSYEDRIGLATAALPIALGPGEPVVLDGGDHAVVVAAGIIVTPNGQQLVRGTLIGPTGESYQGAVATARTPVRLFSLPAVAGLPLLLGTAPGRLVAEAEGRAPGRPPVSGVHPLHSYPPLAVPPGPPPPDLDPTADRRFEKKLRWLLILVLLLALLITGGNVFGAITAWAEMPSDKALLQVQTGTATAIVDGKTFPLSAGDDIYVGAADTVTVDLRSRALMTYRGGATSLLCAGTQLEVATLVSTGRPVAPIGGYDLRRGLVINDTATASPAFSDLALSVEINAGTVTNDGPAFFAVAPAGVQAATGTVFYRGVRQAPLHTDLGCGDGTIARPRPTTTVPNPGSTTPTPTPTPSATVSESPSPSPTATTTTTKPPTQTTSQPPTTTTTTRPPTTTITTRPPVDTPPQVTTPFRFFDVASGLQVGYIWEMGCGTPTTLYFDVTVSDDHPIPAGGVGFTTAFPFGNQGPGGGPMTLQSRNLVNGRYQEVWRSIQIGPFQFDNRDPNYPNPSSMNVTVVVQDIPGRVVRNSFAISYFDCFVVG